MNEGINLKSYTREERSHRIRRRHEHYHLEPVFPSWKVLQSFFNSSVHVNFVTWSINRQKERESVSSHSLDEDPVKQCMNCLDSQFLTHSRIREGVWRGDGNLFKDQILCQSIYKWNVSTMSVCKSFKHKQVCQERMTAQVKPVKLGSLSLSSSLSIESPLDSSETEIWSLILLHLLLLCRVE